MHHTLNERLTVALMFSGVIPVNSSSHYLNELMVMLRVRVGSSTDTFNKATRECVRG